MRSIVDKNYYELLDLTPGASREEIERAYERAMKVYGEDSVVTYTLFSDGERESMVRALREAYETLMDPERRERYDQEIGVGGTPTTPRRMEQDRGPRHSPSFTQRRAHFSRFPVVVQYPDSFVTEQYRVLASRIEELSAKEAIKVISITSALKGEGKTTTAINLSYVLTRDFGKRVLLLEGDIRNPALRDHLLIEDGPGLVDLLEGTEFTPSMLCRIDDDLFCLPASRDRRPSSIVLKGSRFKILLKDMGRLFDYVIIDSSPVIPLVDMNIVSSVVDGVLLVVKADRTPRDVVQKALEGLEGRRLGIILNDAATVARRYYY